MKEAMDAFEALAQDAWTISSSAEGAYVQLRLAHLANDGIGDLSRAEVHLREALRLDAQGTSAAVLDQLGMVLQTAGDLDSAIECFKKAIAVIDRRHGVNHPRSTAPRFHLAVAEDIHAMRSISGKGAVELNATSTFRHWPAAGMLADGAGDAIPRESGGEGEKKRVLRVCSGGGDFSGLPTALVSSWDFAKAHFPRARLARGDLYNGTRAILAAALLHHSPLRCLRPLSSTGSSSETHEYWMVLEFGVSFGKSIRMLADLMEVAAGDAEAGTAHSSPASTLVAGFDTFTGLPEAWGDEPEGAYSTGGLLPSVPPPVRLVPGLFADTLPKFLAAQNSSVANSVAANAAPDLRRKLALANVDCDLFSATAEVLGILASPPAAPDSQPSSSAVCAGSVVCFDEFFMYEGWQGDEARAFFEEAKLQGWGFEFSAWSLASKQVAVKIIKN